MNTAEKNLERQVQIWSLPGPAAILLTVSIVLLTAPFDWATFPLIAFIGMIASFFRGINGAGLSILFLAVATILQLAANGYQNPFWITGGSSALALAWIATALSREEVESILQKQMMSAVIVPSEPIVETKIVEKLVEKVIIDQEGLEKANVQISELETLNAKIQEELAHAIEEIQALQKQGEQFPIAMKKLQVEQAQMIAIVRKDLDDAIRDNFDLEQKLKDEQQERQQMAEAKRGLEMLRIELDNARKSKEQALFDLRRECDIEIGNLTKELNQNEKQYESLKAEMNKIEKQNESLKAEVLTLNFRKVEEISIIKREKDKELETFKKETQVLIETLKKENDSAVGAIQKENLVEIEAQKNAKDLEIEALKKEKDSAIDTLKKEIEELKAKENAVVWGDSSTKEGRELSRVQGMYQQLRDQYEAKSQTLDQTRFELFHTKEKLEALQKDSEEERLFDRSTAILNFERHIKKLEQELHRLESENQALEAIINTIV